MEEDSKAVKCSVIKLVTEASHPDEVPENGEENKPPDIEIEPMESSVAQGSENGLTVITVEQEDVAKEDNTSHKIVEVEEAPNKIVEVEDAPNKIVEVEDAPNKIVEVEDAPKKIVEVEISDTESSPKAAKADVGKEDVIVDAKEDESSNLGLRIEKVESLTVDLEEETNSEDVKEQNVIEQDVKEHDVIEQEVIEPEASPSKKKAAKKKPGLVNGESPQTVLLDDPEFSLGSESDEEVEKPRRRGRCKKNPEVIPPHLTTDLAYGYTMLNKFIETPLFHIFLKYTHSAVPDGDGVKQESATNLHLMRKKFDDKGYTKLEEFVADMRAMLTSIYEESRDAQTLKKALRLEQVLEQRITQLPPYLRSKCSLPLSNDKVRVNKGGGFVSQLLERAEKVRAEKDREKRKVLAEERKQLKEEQDKDVQEWEKNVLLSGHEDDVKSMWELPQIGHFIHLCANILNIGDICQYEVERMLLMPQCSDTLDLLITALLSNSLMRAKLDRTPSMPYSIWSPSVRTRVNSWYKALQREFGDKQKVFEEVGVEPEFWDACGSKESPLDPNLFFHEIPLFQRVWILKTLCDVDFVRKKTVYDNIRQQLLQELHATNLGVDRHGNRYIYFPQFVSSTLRIYRQSWAAEGVSSAVLIESLEGFEERRGEISQDKDFRNIWDVGAKVESPKKKGKRKRGQPQDLSVKIKIGRSDSKAVRQSARAKRKVYKDSSGSDGSDTDLATLKNKMADNQSTKKKEYESLTVFRLPRDKVPPKVSNKRSSYYIRKEREETERLRAEESQASRDSKGLDEEASLDEDNFTVKNLDNLKMVLKKDPEENASDSCKKESESQSYETPAHMLPDRNKFYLVVDSVDSLRQLISQFASDENDLEIISRSALRSGKKCGSKVQAPPSCEVQLIERLQNLLVDLECWEMDFLKTTRNIREKMHKEYTAFSNRPPNFVHPNESYWLKLYEEPTVAPPPEPPPPPVEPPPPEIDPVSLPPPSPLSTLRPRTRTRQQQQPAPKIEQIETLDEEYLEEEYLDSSESDDSWEMPTKKKRRSVLESPKAIKLNKKKISPRKNFKSVTSVDSTNDKVSRTIWSAQSSDPSEELNWEANRQKILEKHNSPRKVVVQSGDIESEMSAVEDALRSKKLSMGKPRILPPPIPGNQKRYYSAAQLKAMAKKEEEQEIQILHATKKRPTARAVLKKSAGTQLDDVIDLDADLETKSIWSEGELFLTDGKTSLKVDQQTVDEVMKDNQKLRLKFGDKFDLNQTIHVVRKTNPRPPNVKLAQTPPRPAVRPNAVTADPPKTSLRFIRPQNVSNQMQFIRPTQVSARPMGTRPSGQNVVFIQTSEAQGQNVGQIQNVRPAGIVQMAQPNKVAMATTVGSNNVAPKARPEIGGSISVVGIMTTGSTGTEQVGFIQGQSGKQQFVQISQPASMRPMQPAAPAISQAGQNIVRLVPTAPPGLRGTPPQQFSIVQMSGSTMMTDGSTLYKTSTSSADSAPPNVSIADISSQGGQVNLVQVQNSPGDSVTYVPVQGGIRSTGNLVAVQTPQRPMQPLGSLQRQPSPVGRVIQMQTPPRSQGPVLQSPSRPQGAMLQMQLSASSVGQSPPRPVGVRQGVPCQTQTPQRPQTTVVQVYASPRMQTAMSQTARPQITTLQVPTSSPANTRPSSLQTSPMRPMGQLIRTQAARVPAPGTIVRVPTGASQGSPVRQVTSMTSQPQLISMSPRPMTVQMSQPGGTRTLGPQVVQVVQGSVSGAVTRTVGPQLVQVQAGTGLPTKPMMGQMVQIQSGGQRGMAPQLIQVQTSNSMVKPVGAQVLQVQASQGATVGTQVITPQSVAASTGMPRPHVAVASNNTLSRPMGPQLVQVQNAGGHPIGAQVVQMPMAGGKTGYYPTFSLVPVGSTPTSTSVKTSLANVVQLQASTMSPGFIQVLPGKQGPSGLSLAQGSFVQVQQTPTTASPGILQVQLQNSPSRAPLQRQPVPVGKQNVYSIQLPKSQENATSRSPASLSGVRLVSASGSPGRFITNDGKSVQTITMPHSMIRGSGNRIQGNRVVSLQQPLIIQLEEEEEDVKIVNDKHKASSAGGAVDILHGELSAKVTADGCYRYAIKTSTGQDHILSNEEVEARRAANEGRMF